MATESDIKLAKYASASNFVISLIAIVIALTATVMSLNKTYATDSNLHWVLALCVGGFIIEAILFKLMNDVNPDSPMIKHKEVGEPTPKKGTELAYLKDIAISLKYAEVISILNLVLFVYLTATLFSFTYFEYIYPTATGNNILNAAMWGALLALIVIIVIFIIVPMVLFPKKKKGRNEPIN